MEYFKLEDSPIYKNKKIITINIDEMPFPNGTSGSYTVLVSRVMNLEYTDYLRFARDVLGAELIGKKSKYITVYFDSTREVKEFIKLLNSRMKYLLNEQQFPYFYKEGVDGEIIAQPFEEYENIER